MRIYRIPSRDHPRCVGLDSLRLYTQFPLIPPHLKAVSTSYQLLKISSYVTMSSDYVESKCSSTIIGHFKKMVI